MHQQELLTLLVLFESGIDLLLFDSLSGEEGDLILARYLFEKRILQELESQGDLLPLFWIGCGSLHV